MIRYFSILLISYCVFAGGKPYNTKPYEFLAGELLKGRIVFLGEEGAPGHRHYLPHVPWLKTICEWKSQVVKQGLKNKTLTLIVEDAPCYIKQVYNFMESDKPFDLSLKLGYLSLEKVYVFHQLAKIKREFEQCGAKLNIVGFEDDAGYDEKYEILKSREEREYIFGHVRDSLLYAQMSTYISKHPAEDILIFYGAEHLRQDYAQKTNPSKLYNGFGYYFGYYFARDFGSRYLGVSQGSINTTMHFNFTDSLAYLKDTDFLIEHGDTVFATYQWMPFSHFTGQYAVITHDEVVPLFMLEKIFSRNILQAVYDKALVRDSIMKNHGGVQPGVTPGTYPPYLSYTFTTFELLTGHTYSTLQELSTCLDTLSENFLYERFSSKAYADSSYYKVTHCPSTEAAWMYSFREGIPLKFLSENLTPEIWEKKVWPETFRSLAYFNNVGLLWLGTPDEQAHARVFLEQFTQKALPCAADYMGWYYENVYHYPKIPISGK